jgi:NAD(P)-dependent dehydrogenase (short-subunit alcohol dehydrogenase family)
VKAVLVAGAAGGIGQAIVRALLASGDVRVFAQSRSRERLETLRERLDPGVRGRLTQIVGDAGDFDGAAEIAAEVEAAGGIDAAIAILGRGFWESGPLLALPPDEWRAVLDEMLTAHFAFARAIVPLLAQRRNGLYLSLGGSAAFEPARDAGLMSIAAAGQAMLTRVLDRERGAAGPRILELVVEGDVATPESEQRADPAWISADDVGGVVAELVQYGDTTWQPKRVSDPLLVMQRMRRALRESV